MGGGGGIYGFGTSGFVGDSGEYATGLCIHGS